MNVIALTLTTLGLVALTQAHLDYTLFCTKNDVGIRWPSYSSNSEYYVCDGVGGKQLTISCNPGDVFTFVLQTCASPSKYIPAPPLDALPFSKHPTSFGEHHSEHHQPIWASPPEVAGSQYYQNLPEPLYPGDVLNVQPLQPFQPSQPLHLGNPLQPPVLTEEHSATNWQASVAGPPHVNNLGFGLHEEEFEIHQPPVESPLIKPLMPIVPSKDIPMPPTPAPTPPAISSKKPSVPSVPSKKTPTVPSKKTPEPAKKTPTVPSKKTPAAPSKKKAEQTSKKAPAPPSKARKQKPEE